MTEASNEKQLGKPSGYRRPITRRDGRGRLPRLHARRSSSCATSRIITKPAKNANWAGLPRSQCHRQRRSVAAVGLVRKNPEGCCGVREADAPQGPLCDRAAHLWASIAEHGPHAEWGASEHPCRRVSSTSRTNSLPEHVPGAVLGNQPGLGQAGKTYERPQREALLRSSPRSPGAWSSFSTDSDTLAMRTSTSSASLRPAPGRRRASSTRRSRSRASFPAIVTLDSQEPAPACGSVSRACSISPAAPARCCSMSATASGAGGTSARSYGRKEHHHLQPRAHEHAAARGEGLGVRDLPRRYADERLGHAPRDEPGEEAVVRRRGRQPAVQLPLGPERGVGRGRALQELRAGPEVGRGLRVPAARVSLPQGRRCDGDHPAARRAVPRRRGGEDPPQAPRRRAYRHRHRPAGEPVLLDRHPGLHPRPEEVQEAR